MASSGSGSDSVERSGSNRKAFSAVEDVAILNSMLEYYDQHKSYPSLEDNASMVDFVENWLHISNDQMDDPSDANNRIETLRRKYLDSSETEDGEPKNSCPIDGLSDRLSEMLSDSGFSNQEINIIPVGGEVNDNAGPSTKKRALESLDRGDDPHTKKTKKTEKDVGDIELLMCMLGYYAKNTACPTDNPLNLRDFIKKCLPVCDDNPLYVYERIIDLHLRYMYSVQNEDGKPGSSSSTDDQEIFKLCKMLLGYRIEKSTLDLVLKRNSGGGDQDHVDKNPEDVIPKS